MDDKLLIMKHGGPAKLAERLGCSVQRVANWMTRGIPPLVRLQHIELFGNPLAKPKRKK